MNKTRNVELTIASGIYLLLVFSLLLRNVTTGTFELQDEYGYLFQEHHQVFDYYKHYLLPLLANYTIVYLAFVFMHTRVMPLYFEKQRYIIGSIWAAVAAGAVFITFTISYTWLDGYLFGMYRTVHGVHTHCAKKAFAITAFIAILYIAYYGVRYFYFRYILYLYGTQSWFRNVRIDVMVILFITVASIVFFTRHNMENIILLLTLAFFYSVVYFVTQYKLFPDYYKDGEKRQFLRNLFAFSIIMTLIPMVFIMGMHGGPRGGGIVAMFLLLYLGQIVIVMPLSWWISRGRLAQEATVVGLRKALKHSEAGLDFLRWQINPHFLFNALNTLYGTALQENASSTSKGIQQLGDMMRFMLHDNMAAHIPLTKEVAYLKNYIALQELRTQSSPQIVIDVNLDDTLCEHEIVPMLLIPFVENAFKYGVSQRKQSRISISLSCTSEKIFFDVYNTVHAQHSADLEPHESMGIGLKNVKQRLEMLYPNKHELSIRETTNEFFVHLTLVV
jgi:two-component system, LytTR family, sensor kinase